MYPYYSKQEIKKVSSILKKGRVNYWTGKECNSFEKEFATYHELKFGVAVSNGSVALEIALKSLKLENDYHAIVTPRSFIISASAINNTNGVPVFADVDVNGNLYLDSIKKNITPKTKVVVLVHLYGHPANALEIKKYLKKKKIFLIEDCSHAHGGIFKNRKIGSFGDLSIWSFCNEKIISTGGEGGMICTNNLTIFKRCWSIKDHGKSFDKSKKKIKNYGKFRWLHENYGSNFRMTEMQAGIGRIQLKRLDYQLKKRELLAKKIYQVFKYFVIKKLFEEPNFKCFDCPKSKNNFFCNNCRFTFYRFNILLNNSESRNKLLRKLISNKINCGSGYNAEIYKERFYKKNKKLVSNIVMSKDIGNRSIAFTIDPYLNTDQIKKYLKNLKKTLKLFFRKY